MYCCTLDIGLEKFRREDRVKLVLPFDGFFILLDWFKMTSGNKYKIRMVMVMLMGWERLEEWWVDAVESLVWYHTIPNQTHVSLVVFQHVDLDPSARLFVIFGHKQCFPSDDTSTTILLPVKKLVDSFTSLKKYFSNN